MTTAYQAAMTRLRAGSPLTGAEATAAMDMLMTGAAEPAQAAALLTALAMRGITAPELTAMARAMRAHARRVEVQGPLLDTCGTGGSGLETANTSTMVAFVAAAAGVKVAKHGNRASSGRCGSADVLEALGVRLEVGPEEAASLLERLGVACLMAPLYHPAVRHVVPVRRALGFRTVFNLLGPLCNPAGTGLHLMGVSDREAAPLMAETLGALGATRAMLVRGEDGLDELTLTGPTRIWELRDGRVTERLFQLDEVGLAPVPFEAIAGGDKAQNTRLFMELLSGRERGPRGQHLRLNAGAALHVAGRADTIAEGYALADALIASGAALTRFEDYRDATARRQEAA